MANRNQIINMALLLIGEEMMASEDDHTKSSDIAAEFLDLCIETALSENDWTFARKRVILGATSITPVFGYEYQFQLPSDYNHIIEVDGDTDGDFREESGFILYANNTMELFYVCYNKDYALLPPKFVDAVVTLLASKIAYAVVGSGKISNDLEQLYEKRMAKAKFTDVKGTGLITEDEDLWDEER